MLSDGSAAASACIAFGVERWLLAFLVTHGPEPRRWPALRATDDAAGRAVPSTEPDPAPAGVSSQPRST
jgi:hypothetical protein